MLSYFLGALGLGGIVFGLCRWYLSHRTLRRLDEMLTAAISGSFQEGAFDETAVSALEAKMARFLNGSAASTRNLAEERAAIQSLLSDLSHQTKTPLANILLYASLLEEEDLSSQQAEQVSMVKAQGEKLSFLIQTLVRASRLETGVFTVTPAIQPLGPLLEDTALQMRGLALGKGLSLTAEPTETSACFDPKWTAEALGNVVDNAIKYTPPGGKIRLSVREFELFCAVEVTDDGTGIPEGEQGAVFNRFYRGEAVREQEGLGIGLYLTREILTRQGGYVKLRSKPGQGCRFSLYLPREGMCSGQFLQK